MAAALVAAASTAHAQGHLPERVEVPPGPAGLTVTGAVTGDETADYAITADAGQVLTVAMEATNMAAYLNVTAQGVTDVGPPTADALSRQVSDYRVRVYLMRGAARRGESSNYRLVLRLVAPTAAKIATRETSGQIPCADAADQPTAPCNYRAVQQARGVTDVTVTLPGGGQQSLRFRAGVPQQPRLGAKLAVEKEADLIVIRQGPARRFEIPEAVVDGG